MPGVQDAGRENGTRVTGENTLRFLADDPLAGRLRVAGGSERSRGVSGPECVR